MAKLELKGLTKEFGTFKAVDQVDLTIEHGEFVCLLGPSGCGKTTTLRLVAGFLEPDGGEIRVGDKTVSSKSKSLPPEKRNMTMVFQSYAVWPHMTVSENIAYGLRMKRTPRAETTDRVNALLEAAQLQVQSKRYPSELSGGQQQRVALARALAPKPDILLLDEPLSNLDANLREDMRFEIRRLHDRYQYTSIYVTHDQAEAMAMADRIVIMNAGRIEQIGTPEEVYERPASEFVARFIGSANVLNVKALGDDQVELYGTPIRCGQGDFAAHGSAMTLAIKTHQLALEPLRPDRPQNSVPGKVVDQAYMGSHRDYIVDIGERILVTAPSHLSLPNGSDVSVHFPVHASRALTR